MLDSKLKSLSDKIFITDEPVTIMILGLGSVGTYLLDYLINLSDPKIELVVVGRNLNKLTKDINIVKTAATIRGHLRSKIHVEGECDLESTDQIAEVLTKYKPSFIVNSSRVYSGLKYGSLSWDKLRAYGIWTPLAVKYARNLMIGYKKANCKAITINTSYSDAVIPWLKSSGSFYPDFGSGNLNHLIPRMKFSISQKENIENLNEIDITLATSHFHDVVISKEGHSENQKLLLDIRYKEQCLNIGQEELLRNCMIPMPVDQKRNMMNASSNFQIINSILTALRSKSAIKFHSPGVLGEIGGYPFVVDFTKDVPDSYFFTDIFSLEDMRKANRESIYLDGIEGVNNGFLIYTDELIDKVKKEFKVELPKKVDFSQIDEVGQFIIEAIIKPNV